MDYTDYYLEEAKRLKELEQIEKAEIGIVPKSNIVTRVTGLSGTSGISGHEIITGDPGLSFRYVNGILTKFYKGNPI